MKYWLFAIIGFLLFAGCKKDVFAIRDGLIGTWELRMSSGTIAGYIHEFPPGNGNTITFLDDTHCKRTYMSADTTINSSGIYKLSEGSNCSGDKVVLLSYPPNNFSSSISISGDTLNINDNCISDGVYNQYQKMN